MFCISHKTLVEYSGNDEKSILDLIRKYKNILKEIGGKSQLLFKQHIIHHSNKSLNKQKIYFLNERQTMLLLTFMRNTEQIIKFKTKLVLEFYRMKQQILLLQKENAIQYREAGIRLNDYDDNFKTISRLIKEYKLEKEFTPKVLNDLLVKENLAEKKKINVSMTIFKHTDYTRYTPPNENTKKASNLIHKDYFLNVIVSLAREKGIRRTTKFIPKVKEGLQETIDKKVKKEIKKGV